MSKPQAQGQGRQHRAITVVTNHVAVKKLPTKTHSLYDGILYIKDNEWKDERFSEKRIRVMDKLQTKIAPEIFRGDAIFDGMKLLFVPGVLALPSGGQSETFDFHMSDSPNPGPNSLAKVIITRTVNEGITPAAVNAILQRATEAGAPSREALQAINLLQLIIRQHSNNIMKPAVNAKAYFTETQKKALGGGVELRRGFFQSVRPTIGRLLINIDTTVAPFIVGGELLQFMMGVLGTSNIRSFELQRNEPNFVKLERALKKLQITVKFNRATTKVIRGLEPNAGQYRFYNDQQGREMTIQEHYKTAYRWDLRHPRIVGIRLTGPNAPRPVIVPAELCTIKPSQFYKRKLSEDMVTQVVKFATLRPDARRGMIEHGLGNDRHDQSPIAHYENSSNIRAAGMEIGKQLEMVQGRMLTPPELTYGSGRSEVPKGGQWNLVKKLLADARALDNWAVVNFASNLSDNEVNRFVDNLSRACRTLGMRVSRPAEDRPFRASGQAVRAGLANALNYLSVDRPALILVLLPESAKGIRQEVKHLGDVAIGVITQCVRQNKVQKANDQYYNNVAIKINARLGGRAAQVQSEVMARMRSAPYMIVGADVSHPAPGQARPSMISLVYSTDADAVRYGAITDIQDARTERIENMERYAYDAIFAFAKRNNPDGNVKNFPARVVFYRDGISEGEFAEVASREVADFKAGVQKAVDELKAAGRAFWSEKLEGPQVTYIVVGKRHHVVFFPKTPQDGDNRTGNLPSGFVTDRGLDSPFAPDFFLQSHSAIQGTSRSSHYVILHDEIWNFGNIDAIKLLSFHLCHTYAKATRAVSIPAPVYYADLACARGAFHFAGTQFENSDSGGPTINMDEWRQNFHETHDRLKRMMYFL
ncbi:Piwi-domain-containing protein [Schizophyllum commune H4-8]|uniref:Piwi-domain-containing protein n=1 Tax=Schizophyllum commune (strain H4-8 / FGSC 9210) TaxID=578458 RepID=UPI00215FE53A|nr:Piwi-domain-containing protein [Schizophyllum commune H4-8]KAI5900235.1 Piwi-domain-containing protein [Schizophyllum commune H4-8]